MANGGRSYETDSSAAIFAGGFEWTGMDWSSGHLQPLLELRELFHLFSPLHEASSWTQEPLAYCGGQRLLAGWALVRMPPGYTSDA